MKIGGYSHSNGITFFCDVFKIKGSKGNQKIRYDIEWIVPPKWLRKLENKFILGGLLVVYYQWKVLDKKVRNLFLFLIGFYLLDEILDFSFMDYYFYEYFINYSLYWILLAVGLIGLNYKKISQTFRYHGAEHKAINCYLKYGYVDHYLIKTSSRFNKRCGSNIASIFLILYLPFWIFNIDSVTIIFIIFLAAIQLTKILSTKNYRWDKYLQVLQWITALEPREEELDIAVGAFNQLRTAYDIFKRESSKGVENIKV